MTQTFPIFQLAEFENAEPAIRQKMADELDRTCRETGFLAVGDHGVSQTVIDGIWSEVSAFFAQPAQVKQHARAPYAGYPYGYLGPGAEALAASRGQVTPPDLKESFNGGPPETPKDEADPQALAFCYADTTWPPDRPQFRAAWLACYAEMERLAARIMAAFAAALNLPDKFFAPFIDAPISALRALNYPAQAQIPQAGQLRAGAHSDYGSLTILLPQQGSRGLEILTPLGEWQAVAPVSGAFIVNIGDLMARWTNDRWVSTLHRVVNDGAETARQSLAFFHQPNWHAEITCLIDDAVAKYPPVKSGPYLMDKFKATAKA
jgi:isopenicillin N synthase-like dioxygenase